MEVSILSDKKELGNKAGEKAANLIRKGIENNGYANIILATGTSQFETIKQLVQENLDWSKVSMFHLDEYVGLPITHQASFRKYLQERFIDKLDPLKNYFLIDGESADPRAECDRLDEIMKNHPVDVALVGIGENGHLAFNDPPADFDIEDAYRVVNLDKKARNQQVGEGWFSSFDDVPKQAITMTIKQVLKSKNIICSVPDARKANAVKCSLEEDISNLCPASILQDHPNCEFYLDEASARLLSK